MTLLEDWATWPHLLPSWWVRTITPTSMESSCQVATLILNPAKTLLNLPLLSKTTKMAGMLSALVLVTVSTHTAVTELLSFLISRHPTCARVRSFISTLMLARHICGMSRQRINLHTGQSIWANIFLISTKSLRRPIVLLITSPTFNTLSWPTVPQWTALSQESFSTMVLLWWCAQQHIATSPTMTAGLCVCIQELSLYPTTKVIPLVAKPSRLMESLWMVPTLMCWPMVKTAELLTVVLISLSA